MATAYWESRARLAQRAYDRTSAGVIRKVNLTYDRIIDELNADIDKIFGTFGRKTGLTPQDALMYLQQGIDPTHYSTLLARASTITNPIQRNQLMTLLRTDSYRARITRIDMLRDAIRTGMTQAADVQLGLLTPHLTNTAHLAYRRTLYDTQLWTEIGFQGVGIPDAMLKRVLETPWAGEHYSTRVWKNRDSMVGILERGMMEQVSIGKLTKYTSRELMGEVDTQSWLDKVKAGMKSKFKDESQYAKYATNRIVRTETAYVSNQATAAAYEECEIEKYEFISVLDRRTSRICQEHDGLIDPGTGKEYVLAEKEVGRNFPPLHPFCRSATAPALHTAEERAELKRRARGADGKGTTVPADMNYSEWDKWQKDGAPKDVAAWRAGKIAPPAAITKPIQTKPVKPAQIPGVSTKTESKPAPVERKSVIDSKAYKAYKDGDAPSAEITKTYGEQGGRYTKSRTHSLFDEYGYTAKPLKVSAEEYARQMSLSGVPTLYRGVNASGGFSGAMINKQLLEGDFYLGSGIYGNGTYSTPTRSVAEMYGSTVAEFSISPTAKIIEHNDLFDLLQKDVASGALKMGANYNFVCEDISRYALEKGYDIIKVTGAYNTSDYYNILNRGVIIYK